MDATNADEENISCNGSNETLAPEERLLQNYKKVLGLIEKGDFGENVGDAFAKTYPGIEDSLKERMKDLEKIDCAIVVAGETSSGKSTLINKLIGHDALAWGVLETTRKIYRVMHSGKIIVKTYQTGCPKPTDHSFDSVEDLHKKLRYLENKATRDSTIYQVDVLIPFSKLQNGNVTIVDTPGIGDSIDNRIMVEEYIPKAVAFVIVMDVSRAGGLQKDRVVSLLSTIKSSSSNMKCYDLGDTLFVRNKWDCLNVEKEERDELKMHLTEEMKAEWPWVNESRIYDISLRKNIDVNLSEYTSRFEQFENAIHDLVKTKENIRIQTHGRYLSGVILEASKVLSDALTVIQKQIDGSDVAIQNFKEHISKTKEAIKRLQSTDEKIELRIIGKIVPSLYQYIHSNEFSRLILEAEPKIETFSKIKIDGEIHDRMEKATLSWLKENVTLIIKAEFDIILQDIKDSYENMSSFYQDLEAIADTQFNSKFKLNGYSWTFASGFAGVSNAVLCSFFFGPQALLLTSTFWVFSTLSLGAVALSKQITDVKEVINESFKKRVESMNSQKLHDLLHKKLNKGLREFYQNILTKDLPESIQNMDFWVELLKKKKTRMNGTQAVLKGIRREIDRCQNDVAKLITSVSKV